MTVERARRVHETLGVSTIPELEAAVRDGRLTTVRGFPALWLGNPTPF